MAEAVLKRKVRGSRRILIDADSVQQRVRELAAELDAVYVHETPLLIGVLNGAITFMTDLDARDGCRTEGRFHGRLQLWMM
ncbi:MAG: hypothetical protein R2855_10750 [Thermomicrobiales bacterium]